MIRSKPMRRAALGRAAAPRRCGRKFTTRQAALNSPAGAAGGYVPEEPCGGCGSYHARAAVPRRADRAFPVAPRPAGAAAAGLLPGVRRRKPRAGAAAGLPKPPSGFSRKVILTVRARAGGGDPDEARCEACGRWLGKAGGGDRGQVQHRRARKAGGSRDPVTNGPANAGLLCGTPQDPRTCHGKCEKRDPLMKANGWWIEMGSGPEHDPRRVPVILHSDDAPWWLGEDGRYLDEDPGLGMAA
jgi:hypothetical protein